jgi:hypothetical protein
MWRLSRFKGPLFVVALVVVASGCSPASSSTSTSVRGELIDRIEVSQIVVRYQQGSPPATSDNRPWGSQCVAREYRDNLERGPSIGTRMKVVTVDPPVLPIVAGSIAREMEQCPYIDWAEPDVVRFDVPSAQDLDPVPTFAPAG